MDAFSLSQLMPGPMFNLSAYIGGLIGGVPGALLCWICLSLPGILLIFTILSFWRLVREYQVVKDALDGFNAGACGLILSSIILLWFDVVGTSKVKSPSNRMTPCAWVPMPPKPSLQTLFSLLWKSLHTTVLVVFVIGNLHFPLEITLHPPRHWLPLSHPLSVVVWPMLRSPESFVWLSHREPSRYPWLPHDPEWGSWYCSLLTLHRLWHV